MASIRSNIFIEDTKVNGVGNVDGGEKEIHANKI